MSTEIAIKKSSEISFSQEQIDVIKKTIAKDASQLEFDLFMNIARSSGLNPFHRQIFFVRRGGVGQTTASIDGLRLIAHRTGEYRGQVGPLWCGEDGEWKDVWTSKDLPVAAKVGVWRHGFSEPLWAVANFQAYNANTPIWKKMPELMIAKCAESLALRRAFPLEMSGIYSNEELENVEIIEQKSVINAEVVPQSAITEKPANPNNPIFNGTNKDLWWLADRLAECGLKNDGSEGFKRVAREWADWAKGKDYDSIIAKIKEQAQ